jgi:6-phosphogluconate dehydrogenase
MDFGVPIPTIDSAVSMRQISAQKETRVLIAKKFGSQSAVSGNQLQARGDTVGSEPQHDMKAALAEREVETTVSEQQHVRLGELKKQEIEKPLQNPADEARNEKVRRESVENFDQFIEQLKNALLASFITTYAQGMSLLQTASVERQYGLDLSEISKIWRGGCIIRSALLEDMRRAFARNADLPNLILDERFAEVLSRSREDWREINAKFAESRVPSLCLSSALAYFDAFCSERLPANLIQAQRDYFGAHTYQRTDKDGIFHTPDWNK